MSSGSGKLPGRRKARLPAGECRWANAYACDDGIPRSLFRVIGPFMGAKPGTLESSLQRAAKLAGVELPLGSWREGSGFDWSSDAGRRVFVAWKRVAFPIYYKLAVMMAQGRLGKDA